MGMGIGIGIGVVIRSVVLSLITGICCQIFFSAVLPKRKWRHEWLAYASVPAFTAGFIIIAFAEILPYVLQPVRVIVMVGMAAFLFFEAGMLRILLLSVLFGGIYWMVSTVVLSVAYLLSAPNNAIDGNMIETVTECILLCVMILFHYIFRRRIRGLRDARWEKFGLFPLLSIIIIVALCMIPWSGTAEDRYARLAAVLGFAVMNIWIFYFITDLLAKEEEVQNLRISKERTRNRVDMYEQMGKSYEQQRMRLHDEKNRLNCIQGLLADNKMEEALAYIAELTGNLRNRVDYVNTNHALVNVILNQKYQEACEKGIVMIVAVNDLSGLHMRKEALVTLLSNLLDNAIEACEKLEKGKTIRFKMVLEDGELILSVQNPVKEALRIKGKTIATSKQDKPSHGIGLLNIDSVIRSYEGTSALTYEGGWFCFSAMIPIPV